MAQLMHSGVQARFAGLRPHGRLWFNLLAAAISIVAVVTVVSALIAIFYPEVRSLLLKEDGIIEMGSVFFLTITVLGAATASFWGPRLPLALAGVLGFAELMDETSFGSRIFGFEPPPLYGGGQLDGFHDLAILAYRLLRSVNQSLAWLWAGLMVAVAVGLLLLALRQFSREIGGTGSWLSGHVLLLLHFGFIGLAQAIDVATSSRILSAMEEVLELDAAILLAFYVAQQACRPWQSIHFSDSESHLTVRQTQNPD